ncbi:MAG: phosphate acyltransferase PlsX [Nitrospinota bacterium]
MKIAVDAMGGDNAPSALVEGAILAYRELGIESILIGNPEKIDAEFVRLGARGLPIEIREATQVIEMGESPSRSLRSKTDSSMRVAAELVKSGDAEAVFSAGDTGGAFAVSLHVLQRMKGVLRPAIAALIPTLKGFSIMLDVGANLVPKPQNLFQFGVMGKIYSEIALGIPNPTVGLLNVGGEESKGTDSLKSAYQLFSKSDLNFMGNVEGNTIFQGSVDVIVCDGFSGNVAIKVSESLSEMLTTLLREEVTHSVRSKIGYMFLQNGLKSMRQRTDYSEYGAAPLLGLNGLTMIGHGRSESKTVKNALRATGRLMDKGLNSKIQDEVDKQISIQRRSEPGWRLWGQIREGIFHGGSADESSESGGSSGENDSNLTKN